LDKRLVQRKPTDNQNGNRKRVQDRDRTMGWFGLQLLIYPFAKLHETIREKTGRLRSGSIEITIAEINPTLKGWYA
jgi:hypothetical protein